MPTLTTSVSQAAAALNNGKLVAFPTETVYGLGGVAHNDTAIRKVFHLKGRPADHPLIIHLASLTMLDQWAINVPELVERIAGQLMPGPLTLVLERKPSVGEIAAGGHKTIAIRVPAHPMAQALLAEVGTALVAPSANQFGRPSPTDTHHVAEDFATTDLLILDGGPTDIGIESTILDLTNPERPCIRRLGAMTPTELAKALGTRVWTGFSDIAVPGNLTNHYSPKQKLLVLEDDEFVNCKIDRPETIVAALGFFKPKGIADDLWIQMGRSPAHAARHLFADIRKLEKTPATLIVVNAVPGVEEWSAITDRLRRAAEPN